MNQAGILMIKNHISFSRVFVLQLGCLLLMSTVCGAGPSHAETRLISIGQLHPTQFVAGMREVEYRSKKLQAKSDSELQAFLKRHALSVVIGPGERLFIVDGHDTALVVLKDGRSKSVHVTIMANLSGSSPFDFWHMMESRHWAYLYNAEGEKERYTDLPGMVLQLQNDPYRSLAYFVEQAGGFEKSGEPFAKIRWANFFRSRIVIDNTDAGWQKAIKQAVQAAHTPEAHKLPGYKPQ